MSTRRSGRASKPESSAAGGRQEWSVEEDDEVNRAVARLGKKAWAQVAEELNASGVTGPGCARTGKQVRARRRGAGAAGAARARRPPRRARRARSSAPRPRRARRRAGGFSDGLTPPDGLMSPPGDSPSWNRATPHESPSWTGDKAADEAPWTGDKAAWTPEAPAATSSREVLQALSERFYAEIEPPRVTPPPPSPVDFGAAFGSQGPAPRRLESVASSGSRHTRRAPDFGASPGLKRRRVALEGHRARSTSSPPPRPRPRRRAARPPGPDDQTRHAQTLLSLFGQADVKLPSVDTFRSIWLSEAA
ncbi:RNA polymerase II transcription regulator recruiting protein [Aureococcus anophagefferens]|nr:RNA polymerase II transcription regulator recruiting protein [Aureococcus anophagefferens]